jgi:predicted Zn-dependent protease
MQKKSACAALLLMTCCALTGSFSCSSLPTEPEQTSKEKTPPIDASVGQKISRKFEERLRIRKNLERRHYLESMVEEYVKLSAELKESGVLAQTIEDSGQAWRSFAFPGVRLYLSVGGLKALQYESEVAALIAIEMAHLVKGHLVRNLNVPQLSSKTQSIEVSEDAFRYSTEQVEEAIAEAAHLISGTAYDSRGLVSLLRIYEANPAHSPYSAKELPRLIELAHQSLVQYPPMRNPVVKSEEFVRIKKLLGNP